MGADRLPGGQGHLLPSVADLWALLRTRGRPSHGDSGVDRAAMEGNPAPGVAPGSTGLSLV